MTSTTQSVIADMQTSECEFERSELYGAKKEFSKKKSKIINPFLD